MKYLGFMIVSAMFAVSVVACPLPGESNSEANSEANAGAIAGAAAGAIAVSETNVISASGVSSEVAQQTDQSMDNTDKSKNYVMVAPSTNASLGQDASSLYSIFGGINLAGTAEYKMCMEKIMTISQMYASDLMPETVAKEEAKKAWLQLKKATRTKRLFSILWETSGQHLGNGFGAFAWGSFWK